MALTVLVIVFAVASVALTLTIGRPATDEVRVFALRVPRLLAAQLLGVTSLLILGIALVRRPALRYVGWIVLGLGLVTAALLVEMLVRIGRAAR